MRATIHAVAGGANRQSPGPEGQAESTAIVCVNPILSRKYPNSVSHPDQPVLLPPQISDPKIPLVITEGAIKADAAVGAGLCSVALLGVWSWRGSNEADGRIALPDWDSIALNGRKVHIAFDSDAMEKPAVYSALVRLKAFLESRGAVFPPSPTSIP